MDAAATIPADGLSYDEALDRFFDARSDAAALRAEIARTSVVGNEADLESDRPDHYEAWLGWDEAWLQAQQSFRELLVCGALVAYWRNPATGERLKLLPSHWMKPAEGPDWGDEPGVFFLRTDVDRLLGEGTKNAKRTRAAPDRDRAEQALNACFPDGVPDPASCPNKKLETRIDDWLRQNRRAPVKRDTILRAAGRRSK